MSLRRITSLTALLSFAGLFVSSIFSFLAPRGPGSSQWEAWGLSKHEWFSMHTNLGILFLTACIIHIVLNIKPITAYLKAKKNSRLRVFTFNFNIALVLTLWVIVSSIFNWPPFSVLQRYKGNQERRGRQHTEEVAEKAERKELPEKPPFFYSRKSIERICSEYDGLNAVHIIKGLEKNGITANADWTFEKIAKENDMETRAVYDALLQVK